MNSKLLKQESVEYNGEQYYIHLVKYQDGKPAIVLYHSKELQHDPEVMVVSTNLDDTEQDQVAVLSDDIYHLLTYEGVLEHQGFLGSGYNTYYCGKLIM